LRAGNLDSLVAQNPFRMGYLGVKSLVDFMRGVVPEKRLDTGAVLVTAANLSDPQILDLLNLPAGKPQK